MCARVVKQYFYRNFLLNILLACLIKSYSFVYFFFYSLSMS